MIYNYQYFIKIAKGRLILTKQAN